MLSCGLPAARSPGPRNSGTGSIAPSDPDGVEPDLMADSLPLKVAVMFRLPSAHRDEQVAEPIHMVGCRPRVSGERSGHPRYASSQGTRPARRYDDMSSRFMAPPPKRLTNPIIVTWQPTGRGSLRAGVIQPATPCGNCPKRRRAQGCALPAWNWPPGRGDICRIPMFSECSRCIRAADASLRKSCRRRRGTPPGDRLSRSPSLPIAVDSRGERLL